MAEMISVFHDGAPIAAILPSMTLSTDDCTLFIFEGTNGGSSEVRVGSSSESGPVNGLWRLVHHGLNIFESDPRPHYLQADLLHLSIGQSPG